MKPKCFHFQATLTLNEAIYFDSQDPDGYVPVYFDVKIFAECQYFEVKLSGNKPHPMSWGSEVNV